MFQRRSRHQSHISKRSTHAAHDYRSTSSVRLIGGLPQLLNIFLCEQLEFFQVILRVQFLFNDGGLTDDSVKKIAVLRHSPAWRRAHVALRIGQNIAVRIRGNSELLRYQHLKSVRHSPWFPITITESEDGLGAIDALHIHSHRLF